MSDLASGPKFNRLLRKIFAFTSRFFCARPIPQTVSPPPSLPWFIKSPCCLPPSTASFDSFRCRSLASFNARRYWFGTSSPLIPVGVGSTALILMGGLKVCSAMSPVHRRLLHHACPVVCRRQAQAEPVVHAGARGGAGSDRRRHDGLSGVAGLSKTGEVCCCRRCRCFEEHRVDFAAAHSAFIGHCIAAMATKS